MLRSLFLLALIFICSCTDTTSSESTFVEDSDIDGFILVRASGSDGFVGTDDNSAKANERPKMKTTFSYDFSMGRHEVTCGEFRKVMKEELGSKSPVQKCENDSLPIVNVTYFDAIVYANALSKKEKRDTAYTYTTKTFDSDGHCTSIINLALNTGANAYRLPTEAEWIFAANTSWDLNKSWNADNSDYKTHKVCKKASGSKDFCDMAGNVMEWVNDWLDYPQDTIMDNYVGPYEGNSLGERIVKGGSFRNPKSAISLFSRGDVYTVTSSTKADYVGFRLAFGKIPSPSWLNGSGLMTESNINMILSPDAIKKLTGTYKTKLVFRNDITERLVYIDYSLTKTKIVEFYDTVSAYHPDISPDGKYVAYCTKPEGVPGKSSIYVRELNSNNRAIHKLDVEAAAIPRWQVSSNGDTTIVYVTSQQSNKDEAQFKSNSTWQVSFRDETFGTPRKIIDGAYHGGVSVDRKIAVTGAQLLRTKFAYGRTRLTNSSKDSIWYNKEQACNVSLSKDSTRRTLFLDFASTTGKKFVGKSYHTHERMFIADSTGKLIKSVGAPSKKTFDHTEWVSKNFVIASLTNANEVHEKIALVNIKDSSTTELVEGDELWHPSMWFAARPVPDTTIDQDSAGTYLVANDVWSSVIMRYKMELLWRYIDSMEVALMGSSRTLYSLSPYLLKDDFFAVNLAHAPNSIYATKDYLNKYIYKNAKKLKYIVLSIDIDFWWKTDGKGSDNFFAVNAPNYPGYAYDANHDYWAKGIPAGLLDATENGLGVEDAHKYTTDKGRLLGIPCQSWGETAEVEADSTIFDKNPELLENSMKALKSILKTAASKKIKVVGVIFPQNPKYKKTGAFGRHGMKRSTAKEVISQIKNLTKEYPNFVLLDENKMGDHDYSNSQAYDNDHLCSEATYKITARVDSVLKTLK